MLEPSAPWPRPGRRGSPTRPPPPPPRPPGPREGSLPSRDKPGDYVFGAVGWWLLAAWETAAWTLPGAGFKYKVKLRVLDVTKGSAPDYGTPDPFDATTPVLLTTPVVDDVTFYISCGTQYLYYYVTY